MDSILSHIRTQSEAQELLTQLDSFRTTFYSVKKIALQDYFSHLPKEIADSVYAALSDKTVADNKENLNAFVNQLQEKLHNCRTIQLTLAFHADDATVSLFSSWAKKNIGNDALLDLQTNNAVVGGTVIVANGQYKDYSIRKKLTQVFQIQKDELLGIVA